MKTVDDRCIPVRTSRQAGPGQFQASPKAGEVPPLGPFQRAGIRDAHRALLGPRNIDERHADNTAADYLKTERIYHFYVRQISRHLHGFLF